MRIKSRVIFLLLLTVAICLASCGETAVDPGSIFDFTLSGDLDEQFYIIEGYTGDAKTISIPSEYNGIPIRVIDDYAFYDKNLRSVVICEGIEEIGRFTFGSCSSLEKVIIPSSVHSISELAFIDSDNMKFIEYSGTEEQWQCFDFYIPEKCEVTIQDSTNDVSTEETGQPNYRDDDVPATKGLKMELNENGTYYRVVGVSGSIDRNVVIPEMYKGIPVKEVADKAFDGCVNIETISMPHSILTVGNSVFYGCDNLISVKIPSAIQMSKGVFTGCSSIKDLTIPADFLEYTKSQPLESITITCVESTYIRKSAFAEHASLKTVTISQGITEIGEDAFANCELLESVSLPDGLQIIGSFAFGECPRLKDVVLPSSLEGIYIAAFKKCTSITEIIIPGSVTSIGECAFYGCSSLQNVMIEEGVRAIGDYTDSSFGVFEKCNIGEIVIPESVTYIDERAFCDNPLQTAIFKNTAGWKIGVGYGLYDPIYLDETDLADNAFAAYILLKVNGSDQYNHLICRK